MRRGARFFNRVAGAAGSARFWQFRYGARRPLPRLPGALCWDEANSGFRRPREWSMRDPIDVYNQYLIPQVSRTRRAANAASTSIRACCASGSSSSPAPVEDGMASVIIAQLLFLEAENPKRKSRCTSTRRAASSPSGLAIYDTMQFIKPRSRRSASARRPRWARCCWRPARRACASRLPNARIMVHQPSGGFQGQASDIHAPRRDIMKVKKRAERDLREAHRPATRRSRRRSTATTSCPPRRPRTSA